MLPEGRDRGQAVQVGAVLLFAVLIVGLSVYQATVVPQQNRAVEFDHSQRVQSDMVDVRNAVLGSATRGEPTFASVKLGTTYPNHVFAVTPGAPSGSLRTDGGGAVTVRDGTGTDVTGSVCPGGAPSTRSLSYTPEYNAYEGAPTTVYENTVLYNRFPDGETLPMTGQRLVQGDTVNLLPLVGNYSRSSVGTATVEPIPGYVSGQTVEAPSVSVPTRLSESRWEALLDGEVDASRVSVSGGTLTLDFASNRTVLCSPVGVGGVPEPGARETASLLTAGGGGSGSLGNVNPSGPSAVTIADTSYLSGNETVTLAFENDGTDSNRTMVRMRIPFISTGRNNAPGNGTVRGSPDTRLEITGDYRALNDPITVPRAGSGYDNTEDVLVKFDGKVQNQWFILSVIYANGEQSNYFVVVP